MSLICCKVMGGQFGLIDIRGDKWKRMRKAANPPFSLPKVKKFFPYFTKNCWEMVEYINERSGSTIDCKDFIRNVVLNTLASVGFGMEANCFKNPNSELKKQAFALMEIWRFMAILAMPSISALFRINIYNPKARSFFESIAKQSINRRQKDDVRKDILGALVNIHKTMPTEMTEDGLIKTYLQFIIDGVHTSADNITGVIYQASFIT